MNRLGVFVDAGYLFAQGSAAISGKTRKRTDLSLNEQAVITQLIEIASAVSGGTPLLRIYWYDGIGRNGLTLDQTRLANSDNVKVRMGSINGSGQQKGVDSMIVIDMIELARNHAIADAVLISGDEDVRVGVQFAQNYGVRVHLVGISAAEKGHNQSAGLIHESDTHSLWSPEVVQSFLSVRTSAAPSMADDSVVEVVPPASVPEATSEPEINVAEQLESVVVELVKGLVPSDLAALKDYVRSKSSVPREFDARLLGACRSAIGRDLEDEEKKRVRKKFKELVKAG